MYPRFLGHPSVHPDCQTADSLRLALIETTPPWPPSDARHSFNASLTRVFSFAAPIVPPPSPNWCPSSPPIGLYSRPKSPSTSDLRPLPISPLSTSQLNPPLPINRLIIPIPFGLDFHLSHNIFYFPIKVIHHLLVVSNMRRICETRSK